MMRLFSVLFGTLFGTLLALSAVSPSAANAEPVALKVYMDPNCGCCSEWVSYMEASGFLVESIKTADVAAHKQRLNVPAPLASCHTAVIQSTGQVIEGHVPVSAVRKMLTDSSVRGIAAPGMPTNAPGMGELNGKLVTVDFQGRAFSVD